MRFGWVLACLFAAASTASAQSAYVGATLFGDVVRVSGTSIDSDSGGGETYGGALRAGMPLGEHWGVELEFARSGTLETTPNIIYAQTTISFPVGDPAIFPIPQFEAERQLTTISTLGWFNREVNDRVSLVFLGGVAFTRSSGEFRISYPGIRPLPPTGGPILIPSPREIVQRTTTYDADVAVGFEGRIGMTEHVRLVPGIRLQTIAGGWAIRPGVGLQWTF